MKRRGLHRDSEGHSPSSTESRDDLDAGCKSVIPGWGWGKLIVALVIFRTINALLTYTAFVPDEYWQALEVAHKMVFGYPYKLKKNNSNTNLWT